MANKQFKAESKRLLDLMINSIYTNKEIFLRELISNASDAIDKLYFRSLTDKSLDIKREDLKIRVDIDKDARTLTITDNGKGMSPETLKKIKEPFFTTKIHGTGLGVPLMYEIIEAHDWKLDYESILDEGTTVKIFMKKSKII